MGPEAVAVGTRRATAAQWAASTLVMQEGEQGLDTDSGEVKYGDGVHTWSGLPVFGDADGGNGGGGGGGTDALTVVPGGTVTLNDALPAGMTLGYLITAPATLTGQGGDSDLDPGVYTLVRTPSGWDIYPAVGGITLGSVADATAPTAGTLTATGGESQVALSVTGAADETALNSAPYSFSVDGGATFGSWQSSSSATVTGLSAGTITCRHRVRDAAGNISLGVAKNATVTAPVTEPSWTITDTFTATDGTSLSGRSTATGSKTYLAPLTYETQGANDWGVITGNAITASDGTNRGAAVTMSGANVAAEVTYDLTAGGGGSGVRAVLWVNTVSETDALVVHLRGNGGIFLFRGGGVDVPLTGATTGVAMTGTLRMSIQGNTVTITSSAGTATATVATGTGYTGTGRRLGFAAGGAGAAVDNFKAAEL